MTSGNLTPLLEQGQKMVSEEDVEVPKHSSPTTRWSHGIFHCPNIPQFLATSQSARTWYMP